ncbi:hypothetical protein ID0464_11400 [Helicobacter pylori]
MTEMELKLIKIDTSHYFEKKNQAWGRGWIMRGVATIINSKE